MKRLTATIDSINGHLGKVFSFALLAATIVIVYGVIMRYVFNDPSPWALEMSIFLCAFTYLMGGAYAELFNAHVRVDVLYIRWSPRTRAIMTIASSLLFFVPLILLGWTGAEWTANAMETGVRYDAFWRVVVWPIRLFIPLGCFLLALQGVSTLVRSFHVARTGRPEAEIGVTKIEEKG
ncbi:TRAP transporter small permease subunit [Chloroflexota bacterium]